jgi:ribosomal RNA assembly protein
METLYFKSTREISKEKKNLEDSLNVKIDIKGRVVSFTGSGIDEYEASIVLEAMQFGFSAKKALLLKDENNILRILPIKHFTKRRDMKEVRARLIGTEGKTKKTIEEIASCHIIIKGNNVGILGPASSIDEATTGITNLIRGSKQANVYRFLERMNAEKKKY